MLFNALNKNLKRTSKIVVSRITQKFKATVFSVGATPYFLTVLMMLLPMAWNLKTQGDGEF
jgi:hypothetical protein